MGKKDPLYEVIFDIASNVQNLLGQLSGRQCATLMDVISGSRGLCHDHVIPWAEEFQAGWDNTNDNRDYIDEVDTFAAKKFVELRRILDKPASIQVVPTTNLTNEVVAQFGGPDEHTTNWSVYERGHDGVVKWIADFGVDGERYAMHFAAVHAVSLGVPIEPPRWKKPPAQVEDASEKTYHVSWWIEVQATSTRAAAEQALRIQRDPTSIATMFDVRGHDHGARIDLSENAQ